MSQNVDITEVSDPRDLTIDIPVPDLVPEIKIVKGSPTDEDVAALVTLFASAGGGTAEVGPQELNKWGHPVDQLRYSRFSWQTVTLVERTHMRR